MAYSVFILKKALYFSVYFDFDFLKFKFFQVSLQTHYDSVQKSRILHLGL